MSDDKKKQENVSFGKMTTDKGQMTDDTSPNISKDEKSSPVDKPQTKEQASEPKTTQKANDSKKHEEPKANSPSDTAVKKGKAEDTKTADANIVKKPVNKTSNTSDATEEDKPAERPPRPVIAPPSFSSGSKAHWYVVHTYSGHEQKVSNTLKQRIDSLKLKDKILDIIIPTQAKIEIKEGTKNEIKEKIFPGYLLVNMIMDDNSWLAVRTTPGITGFIGTSTKPTPLPEEEVKTIKRYMTMEAPKFKTTFAQGEAIKITDGPFNEFLGTISEIDEDKGKIKVMVSVFGRETPVELDLLQVAKL